MKSRFAVRNCELLAEQVAYVSLTEDIMVKLFDLKQ